MNFIDLARVLPAVLVGSAMLGAAWRLFHRAPGWPQRTLVLAAALAVQWTIAPLAATLCAYLLRQLPLLLLFLVVLACLLRPHHFF